MNSLSQALFAVLGVVFLLKGGFSIILALWRVLIPLALIGGGFYFVKQYFFGPKALDQNKEKGAQRPLDTSPPKGDIITICPHCLQEKGSCPKCR